MVKTFFLLPLYLYSITLQSSPLSKVDQFYIKKEYNKGIKYIENYLKNSPSPSISTDLLTQHYKLSIKTKYNFKPYFKKLFLTTKDKNLKHFIAFKMGEHFYKKGLYFTSLKWLEWIENNNYDQHLYYDDCLYMIAQIYKDVGAYKKAIKYFDKIISTQQFPILMGSYNMVQIYDAYIEKSEILFKLKMDQKGVDNLVTFVENYPKSVTNSKALYLLCLKKVEMDKYCKILSKKHPYSPFINKINKKRGIK